MSSKRELLFKLRKLASEGTTEGERTAAEERLNHLMDKYDIEEDELVEEETTLKEFGYHNELSKNLLRYVIYEVLIDETTESLPDTYNLFSFNDDTGVRRKRRNVIGAYCTKAQAIEIEFLYDFYYGLFLKEQESLMIAFILEHDLGIPPRLSQGNIQDDWDPDEAYRINSLRRGLRDETPLRRITSGEDE